MVVGTEEKKTETGVEKTRKRIERLIRKTAAEDLNESLRMELIGKLIGIRELLDGGREEPGN